MSSNDRNRSNDSKRAEKHSLKRLEDSLGHHFSEKSLLERALTHPSMSSNPEHTGGDYERLEFLGDRVLGLVIAEMLFRHFPDEAEGNLAKRHAQLVRKETLADIARELVLGNSMRLEMGDDEARGRENPGLLSDACEAVIAALYLDGGLGVAKQFIHKYWQHRIEAEVSPPADSKTRLQEWAQGRGLPLPKYAEVARSGPAHSPVFTVSVQVEGRGSVEGEGKSKRIAEQDAATKMLKVLEGSFT